MPILAREVIGKSQTSACELDRLTTRGIYALVLGGER
jgi:hypothetical protein